jgi:hypothetical protein
MRFCFVSAVLRGGRRRIEDRSLGPRCSPGWSVWIQGDALLAICKQFRLEYIKLEEQNEPGLQVLDYWARDILDELSEMSVWVVSSFVRNVSDLTPYL